jgi:hypothetical protein
MSVKLNKPQKKEMEASKIKPNTTKQPPMISGIRADLSNLILIVLIFFELVCFFKPTEYVGGNLVDTELIVAKLVGGVRQFAKKMKKKATINFISSVLKDLKIS